MRSGPFGGLLSPQLSAISDTLTGVKKTQYSIILALAKAYERGDWVAVTHMAKSTRQVFDQLPLFYEQALDEVKSFYAAL